MSSLFYAFALTKIIIFAAIICLCFIYSIPIVFLSRFRHRSNILTANLTIAFLCCCIYWLTFCVSFDYYKQNLTSAHPCVFQMYAQMMCTCQLVYAFVVIPINRLFPTIFPMNVFFKTNQWLITCVACQWMLGFLIPLPLIFGTNYSCDQRLWTLIYRVLMMVILPIFVDLLVNVFFFAHIHCSFRRVRSEPRIYRGNTSEVSQNRITRHDIRLLRYVIWTFCVFLIGWCPVSILISIGSTISPIHLYFYLALVVVAEASLLLIIINLFRYNRKLSTFLKKVILCRL